MAGGAVAGALACPLYGDHAEWLDPIFPWGDKHHDKNTACHSAVSPYLISAPVSVAFWLPCGVMPQPAFLLALVVVVLQLQPQSVFSHQCC